MNLVLKILFVFSFAILLIHLGWYFEWSVATNGARKGTTYIIASLLVGLVLLISFFAYYVHRPKNIPAMLGACIALAVLTFLSGNTLYRLNIETINTYFNQNIIVPIQSLIDKRVPSVKKMERLSQYVFRSFEYPVLVKIEEELTSVFMHQPTGQTVQILLTGWDNDFEELPIFVERDTIISYKQESKRITLGMVILDVDLGEKSSDKLTNVLERNDSRSNSSRQIVKEVAVDVVWSKRGENILHHWGDVFDGKIFLPGRKFVRVPNVISESFLHSSFSNCGPSKSVSETIEVFDLANGHLIESIEVLPILAEVHEPFFRQFLKDCEDPIHLNDIVVIKSQSHADFFPGGQVGDLLISMREINTIALLDRESGQVKWHSSVFAAQHSPRITNYGTIMVFDNLGSNVPHGQSRITEIAIKSNTIVGIWEATSDDHFETETHGRIQLIDERIFVQESNKGRLFELVCPARPISVSCEKRNIFGVPSDNVFVLDVLGDYGG